MIFTIFINLFLALGILAAQAADDDNDKANRLGRPVGMTRCPTSGEFVTTAWEFDGQIIDTKHTCNNKCLRLPKVTNWQKEYEKTNSHNSIDDHAFNRANDAGLLRLMAKLDIQERKAEESRNMNQVARQIAESVFPVLYNLDLPKLELLPTDVDQ